MRNILVSGVHDQQQAERRGVYSLVYRGHDYIATSLYDYIITWLPDYITPLHRYIITSHHYTITSVQHGLWGSSLRVACDSVAMAKCDSEHRADWRTDGRTEGWADR